MFDHDHCCLVLRPVVKIDYEFRCFWFKQLRAVSCDCTYNEDLKKLVLDYFKLISDRINYHACTIDVGITDNHVFLIELNSFGPDMLATGGHFNWKEDLLFHAPNPIFRFKNEYAW
jgi:hypothetical protein